MSQAALRDLRSQFDNERQSMESHISSIRAHLQIAVLLILLTIHSFILYSPLLHNTLTM